MQVCPSRACPSLAGCGSLSPPALPPYPLLAPNFTYSQVGPQSWSSGRTKPTSHRVIRGHGSCIFWFSAIAINGKVMTFLMSQFLYWVPARIRLRKLYQHSLCHLYWSDMTTAGLWRKEKWALQNFLSPLFTQDEATDLEWEKHKNLYRNNKKGTLQILTAIIPTLARLPIFWDSEMYVNRWVRLSAVT